MDRLLCLVATRPVVPEPCNGSNRRSILLAFHTDKRKRTSEVWMSFLVDSDSESQLEVLFHITDEIFPFKTSYHRRCPQLFHKGCTILVVFYCVGTKLGLRRQD